MVPYGRVATLARQAASILPGPPADRDPASARAWRALVAETVERIGQIAGCSSTPGRPVLVPCHALTWEDLFELVLRSCDIAPGDARPSVHTWHRADVRPRRFATRVPAPAPTDRARALRPTGSQAISRP